MLHYYMWQLSRWTALIFATRSRSGKIKKILKIKTDFKKIKLHNKVKNNFFPYLIYDSHIFYVGARFTQSKW